MHRSAKGSTRAGLISYGPNYRRWVVMATNMSRKSSREANRPSARRAADSIRLVINLKTAKEIGLRSTLTPRPRDEVIE